MSREQIFEQLNTIFHEIFDNKSIIVTEMTAAKDVEGWDSLEHINIISAVEQEFDLKFTMGEVIGMKNVGEMVNIIMERKTK
jgi:acyl carrier protein